MPEKHLFKFNYREEKVILQTIQYSSKSILLKNNKTCQNLNQTIKHVKI